MKPYIYEDPDGEQLRVEDGAITAREGSQGNGASVIVSLPDIADDAIELAQKILQASGIDAKIITE